MYRENCDTVFPIKKQTMVASSSESGISGPALRAMIGKVNTMLVAGAMCVTPWKTSSGRPSELRRSSGSARVFSVGIRIFYSKRCEVRKTGTGSAVHAPAGWMTLVQHITRLGTAKPVPVFQQRRARRLCSSGAPGERQNGFSGERRKLNLLRLAGVEPHNFFDFRCSADGAHDFHAIKRGLYQAASLVGGRRGEDAQKRRTPGPDGTSQFFAEFPFERGQVRFRAAHLSAGLHKGL